MDGGIDYEIDSKMARNGTIDRPLDKVLNRLLYTSRLTAHALPANTRPAHIVPAHGVLENLVDAIEVASTWQ